MNVRRKSMALAGVLVGLGITAAIAIALNSGGEPPPPAGDAASQDTTASSGGISLHLVDTVFSGSGTTVKLDVAMNAGQLPQGAQPPAQQVLVISRRDIQISGFQPGQVTTSGGVRGLPLILQLPAVVAGAKPVITIKSIGLIGANALVHVAGNWTLAVRPPAGSAEGTVLSTEALRSHTVLVQGVGITIHGSRSASSVELDYGLPPGWRELSPAVIVAADGTATLPYKTGGSGATGGQIQAFFGPSAAPGSSFQVRLGPWSKPGGQAASLSVNLAAALDRAGLAPDSGASNGKARPFAVQPADVLSSSAPGLFASADLSTEGGTGCPCQLVEVTVNGDYHPADGKGATLATVTGASGQPLKVTDEQVSYRKNADLNVGLGTTTVSFRAPARAELDKVTINLGAGSVIIPRTDVFTMSP